MAGAVLFLLEWVLSRRGGVGCGFDGVSIYGNTRSGNLFFGGPRGGSELLLPDVDGTFRFRKMDLGS